MTESPEVHTNDYAFVYLDIEKLPIAWLAYRGVISSVDVVRTELSQPSWFLVHVVQRGVSSTLRREGWLEGYRQKHFPHKLSRLTSVYAFPTLAAAARGHIGLGKIRRENLVAISPRGAVRREEHDMEIATNFDALGTTSARDYWHGTNKLIQPELLLKGRFSILGTSVRKRAHEVVKREDPKSLCMLELSRLAAYFGFDLGSITPWLMHGPSGPLLTFVIRYDENEGMEVWRRTLEEVARNPTFPVDWSALEPLTVQGDNKGLDELFTVGNLMQLDVPVRQDKLTVLESALSEALSSDA